MSADAAVVIPARRFNKVVTNQNLLLVRVQHLEEGFAAVTILLNTISETVGAHTKIFDKAFRTP